MNETLFWSMIEEAWSAAGGWTEERLQVVEGEASDEEISDLADAMDDVVPALRQRLQKLSKEDLLAFDRVLEKKLWDIDRMEIHGFTDGSDDGFLYTRGFFIALGRDFYDLVNADPSKALPDVECEDMCYLAFHLYRDKFGEMPKSDISRETGSNLEGWEQA